MVLAERITKESRRPNEKNCAIRLVSPSTTNEVQPGMANCVNCLIATMDKMPIPAMADMIIDNSVMRTATNSLYTAMALKP